MSSSLELQVQTIISHDFLGSFSSDELCIHLAILGLAEASIGGEIWGAMVNIRQTNQKGHNLCRVPSGKLLRTSSERKSVTGGR